jgi:multiple sugar transport system permease protein
VSILTKRDNRIGIAFLIPALLLLIILIVYPLVNAFFLSFHSQLIYELQGRFVGLQNYIRLFKSEAFWHSFKLTLLWVIVTVIGQVILGVTIALFLNEEFKGRGLARALILLPFFMPTVSVALMWKWVLNESYGIVNHLLLSLSIIDAPVPWLSSSSHAMISVLLIGIWRYFPFVVINVLARLQGIPIELYEAAKVDGANFWHELRYITLPEIKGVLSVVILLRVVFMAKKFDEILLLTNGGPGSSTQTLSFLAYDYAFNGMQLGRGAAVSVLLFIMMLGFIVAYVRVAGKKQEGMLS